MPDNNSIIPNNPALPAVTPYCPSEIVEIFNDFLAQTKMGTKVVYVSGIFLKTGKQAYYGVYYDTLKDQNSDQELSVSIPQNLRDELDNGSLVTLGGTIFRRPGNRGNIQLGLKVTRVETLQQQAVSEEDMKRAELRAAKTQKGFTNVDSVLENILMRGERPKVALVFAESSITMADFDAGKHAAEASMDFTEYRVNFASSSALCDCLDEVDGNGYDLVALVRGGGSGIEHLDDLDVIEKVVSLNTPLICAVGHVEEKLFLKLVSDKVAPTPNGLGQWFSDIAEKVTKTRQDSIAVITKQVEAQFKERLEVQAKQNKELQEKLSALTKQAEASQKQSAEASKKLTEQHAADNKKLQEQLSEANKKNGELNKTLQEQNKAHTEQMTALNKTLEEFKKSSSEQAREQNKSLQELQKSNGDLMRKNSELSASLSKATAEAAELRSKSGGPGALTIVLGIAVAILLILLLVK